MKARLICLPLFFVSLTATASPVPVPGQDGFTPCREVTSLYDMGDEGQFLFYRRVFTYTYSSDGRLLRSELDGCPDFEVGGSAPLCVANGETDQVRVFGFDSQGLPTTENWDVGADGSFEITNRFVHDDSGQRIMDETDLGADGTIDRRISYTNNESGEPVTVLFDFNDDGESDYMVVHEYDSQGREIVLREDAGADGNFEFVQVLTYNEAGKLELEETDGNGDGVADQRLVHLWEGDRLLATSKDMDNDGTVDIMVSYEYSEDGNLTSILEDAGSDHVYEAHILYEYSCP